jgi:hypothetical protein
MKKKLSGWQMAGLVAGIGCFTIVVVVVVGVAIAVSWARSTVAELGDPTPANHTRTVTLGQPGAGDPAPSGGASAAAVKGGGSKSGDPLRLTVELAEGDFTVRKGPAGGQVQVEGTYAEGMYELTENTAADEAGHSRTTIRFKSKAPMWARILGGMGEGSNRPRLTVLIPADVPIDLSLRVGMGESRIDLGGLMLSDLGIDLSMGNHILDFKEPVVGGLRRVRLNASMGNISVDNLGNTGAEAIEATGNMGNFTADLGGAWQPESNAELNFSQSMGQLTLQVPSSVRLDANITSSQGGTTNRPTTDEETKDPKAPTLRVRMNTSMGEGLVVRY